ncbi:MAG: hypothetical protein ACYCT2_09775 [Thermoplasmataceae archaeon]
MLYRDVEKRLDTSLTLTMEQQHPLLPLVEREVDTIPLDFHSQGGESFIDLFVCGDSAEKLEGVLAQFRPAVMGGCTIVSIKAGEMGSASAFMDRLGEIPLSVRGSLYLKDRKIYADYRLASSSMSAVTEVGRHILDLNNRIRIADLSPGSGGIAMINGVDSRIHLGIVSYEANIMRDFTTPMEEGCLIEYNFSREEERGFRAIVYGNEGENVAYLDSPFLREVQKLSVERKIPKAAIIARPVNGRYRSFTFLPNSMVDDQVSMLYRVADKFPDADFRLLAIHSYGNEVWEWI